jgi:hypothetical protein
MIEGKPRLVPVESPGGQCGQVVPADPLLILKYIFKSGNLPARKPHKQEPHE